MRGLHRAVAAVMLVAIVFWSGYLRLWNLGGRPFWRDEAWVGQAVRDLDYATLLRQTDVPLPPLFAVVVKSVGQVVGPPELAWRLFSAICGVLTVALVYPVVRLLRGPRSVALAVTGLCASGLTLVIWSRELKQYSFEGLASVLAIWLVLRARRAASTAQLGFLGGGLFLLGLVGPWVGYGSAIPLAVALLMLLVCRPLRGPRWRCAVLGLVAGVALIAGLWSVWHFAARGQAAQPALAQFTSHWYIDPLSVRSWARAGACAAKTTAMTLFPAEWFLPAATGFAILALLTTAVAIWPVALAGCWLWPRHGRLELAWWLLGTWLGMVAAAVARCYPFGVARMMLMCSVPLVVVFGAGVVLLLRRLVVLLHGRGAPALAAAVLLGTLPAVYVIRQPWEHRYFSNHDFPRLLRRLAEQRLPGEMVLVENYATPCVRYYQPDLPSPVVYLPTAAGTLTLENVDYGALARDAAQRAGRRLWILGLTETAAEADRPTLKAIQTAGFEFEVVERLGSPGHPTGTPELLLATRRSSQRGE